MVPEKTNVRITYIPRTSINQQFTRVPLCSFYKHGMSAIHHILETRGLCLWSVEGARLVNEKLL